MSDVGGGGHPYIGGFSLVAGAAMLTAAFLPGSTAPVPLSVPSVAGVPGLVLAGGGLGLVLLAVGGRLLHGTVRSPDGSLEAKTETSKRRKATTTDHPTTSPGGTHVQRTADTSSGPQTEEEKRMDSLEEKIKAIDRRMSQAKVKLGTGELSPEGYQKVMDELEEKRAQLEKERVDLELDQSDL